MRKVIILDKKAFSSPFIALVIQLKLIRIILEVNDVSTNFAEANRREIKQNPKKHNLMMTYFLPLIKVA